MDVKLVIRNMFCKFKTVCFYFKILVRAKNWREYQQAMIFLLLFAGELLEYLDF